MLQVLCGTSEGDSDERILAVQPRLRALGLHDDEVGAVLTALGATAPPSARATRTSGCGNAFTRMVQSLCEDRPHAFAWDVAHAMDEDSFALLEEVRRTAASTSRLVFAFAGARGLLASAREGGRAHRASTSAISPRERSSASWRCASASTLAPDELLRFVRARASGHPLFVEEVVKGLVDAGALTVADRRVSR